MTRTRIKPISDKLRAAKAEYRKRVREWLKGKKCAVFPQLRATEVHHKFGRRGRLLLWEPGWRAVSTAGHARIHTNYVWARNEGLIGPVGTWNDYEKVTRYINET